MFKYILQKYTNENRKHWHKSSYLINGINGCSRSKSTYVQSNDFWQSCSEYALENDAFLINCNWTFGYLYSTKETRLLTHNLEISA